jgi:hypothetical protein
MHDECKAEWFQEKMRKGLLRCCIDESETAETLTDGSMLKNLSAVVGDLGGASRQL